MPGRTQMRVIGYGWIVKKNDGTGDTLICPRQNFERESKKLRVDIIARRWTDTGQGDFHNDIDEMWRTTIHNLLLSRCNSIEVM